MLEPILRVSLTDAVFARLKDLILEGQLQPGDRIPSERELCSQLGVSRTAIREAKRALVVTGMLDARAGQGTFVADDVLDFLKEPLSWGMKIEPESVRELVEARRILEVASAGLAAERATHEQRTALRCLTQQMQLALEANDMAAFLRTDLAWHAAVAEAARNRVLVRVALAIRGLLKTFMAAVLQVPGSAEIAIEGHERLAEAIVVGDADRARGAMENHLRDMQTMIIEQLERALQQTAT